MYEPPSKVSPQTGADPGFGFGARMKVPEYGVVA